jgi:hypothetical protein
MNHPSHVVSINCPPNVDFGVVYVPEDENDDGDADGEDAEEYYAEEDAEGYGYEEEEVEERDGDQDWSAEADTSWNASSADKKSKVDRLQAAPHKGMESTGEAEGVVEKGEGNEENNPAESTYLHEESGPEADHQTLADNTPAQEAAKSAKLTVVNDSAVPVLLVAVHCLPRVPQSEQQNHSDAMSSESATNDAGTTTVSNPNLFQAQLPPNGLLINPGHKEDVDVVCVAPCFSGASSCALGRANMLFWAYHTLPELLFSFFIIFFVVYLSSFIAANGTGGCGRSLLLTDNNGNRRARGRVSSSMDCLRIRSRSHCRATSGRPTCAWRCSFA